MNFWHLRREGDKHTAKVIELEIVDWKRLLYISYWQILETNENCASAHNLLNALPVTWMFNKPRVERNTEEKKISQQQQHMVSIVHTAFTAIFQRLLRAKWPRKKKAIKIMVVCWNSSISWLLCGLFAAIFFPPLIKLLSIFLLHRENVFCLVFVERNAFVMNSIQIFLNYFSSSTFVQFYCFNSYTKSAQDTKLRYVYVSPVAIYTTHLICTVHKHIHNGTSWWR